MAGMVRCSAGGLPGGGVLLVVGLVLGASASGAPGPVAPSLGAARSFALLAAATVANTGVTSVTGDVGVSPGTAITGFPPGTVTAGSFHSADATAGTAQFDAGLAFTALQIMAPGTDLTGTDLGGLTLTPGVYSFSSSAQLTGTLTLDAQCDTESVFVFRTGSTLITAAGASVVVINGVGDYDESNLFWQVGSSATLGAGTAFAGSILAYSDITIEAGVDMVGNAIALNGTVTTDSANITSPPLVVDDSTIVLTPYWGHMTDMLTAKRDILKVRSTYAFGPSPDGEIHPDSEEVTIVVGPLGETTSLTRVIPAGHATWRLKKGAWIHNSVVDGITWKIKLNTTTRFFEVYVGRFDFTPGDGVGEAWGLPDAPFPAVVSLTCGNDKGIDTRCWRNSLKFNATRNWGVLRLP